ITATELTLENARFVDAPNISVGGANDVVITSNIGTWQDPRIDNTGTVTATLHFVAATTKIIRSNGSWIAEGFAVGQTVIVLGANTPANNGRYQVLAGGTDLELPLGGGALTEDAADTVAGVEADPATVALLEYPPSNPRQQPQTHVLGQG